VAKVSISNVDRVSMPSNDGPSGRSFDPSGGVAPNPSGPSKPAPSVQPETPWTKPPDPNAKKGPGSRTLGDGEKLKDDYLDRIEQQVNNATSGKGAEWNIGGVPGERGEPVDGQAGGEGNIQAPQGPQIGELAEQMPGGDTRIWVNPEQLSNDVDSANGAGESAERAADADAAREQKTDSEKTVGGRGKGRGRVRDRVAVEKLSQTDWAAIFKSKLTEFSREKAKYQPWNRRFVGNKSLRTRIGQKTPIRDVLPALNVLIDTSSSLSYRELSVLLSEIKNALASAKIKHLNVFMWHHQPYAFREWKDFTVTKFNELLDWVFNSWEGGGNDEIALYKEIIARKKSKLFTISLTDAYLDDHMRDGELKQTWTKALDPSETIFAIIYPSKAINYEQWIKLGDRMPGKKIPVFLDSSKFD